MKIFLLVVLAMVDAMPRTRHESSTDNTSFARNLCELCSCTSVDVFCNALHDPSLLLHYEGLDVESLSIRNSSLSNLREEHFAKFRNIKDLSLISNKLAINSTELGLLQDLMFLNLQSNSLRCIAKDMFDGNSNLIKLSMSKNKISRIANGTFSDLRRVTSLRIDHNHIKSLELEAFCGLPALEELDLSHNFLDHIDAAWFDPLPRLQTLRLEHNKVVVFEPALVQLMVRRELVVSLASNPVLCECGLVRDAWQAAQNVGLALDVTCANGRPWGEVLTPMECGSTIVVVPDVPGAQTALELPHVALLGDSVVYAIWAIVILCILLSIALMIVVVSVWKKPSVYDNAITYSDVEPHYETLD